MVHDNNNPCIQRYDYLPTQAMTGVLMSSGYCTAWGAKHSLPSLKMIEIKRWSVSVVVDFDMLEIALSPFVQYHIVHAAHQSAHRLWYYGPASL